MKSSLTIDSQQSLSAAISSSFVERCEFRSQLGSTNDRALEVAKTENGKAAVLFYALDQFAGRGRSGARWFSPKGGLAFSILLSPSRIGAGFSSERQQVLSLIAALAVTKAAQEISGNNSFGCKWPNDVIIASPDDPVPFRKLSGILVEVPKPDRMVIGIGINVNNAGDQLVDQNVHAVSLADVAGQEFSTQDVLRQVLATFEQLASDLASLPDRLPQCWAQSDLLREREIKVDLGGGEVVEGMAQGIDTLGNLILSTRDGERRIASGTVAFE